MNLLALLLTATAAVCFFGTTIAAFMFILLNKGARMNVTWGLIAFGATCFGAAKLLILLVLFLEAVPYLEIAAALCLLASALHARSLYKGLLK